MNASNWHRGDRCLHRPSGQRGIVEGWKDDKLYVYWGTNNCQRAESWVADEDCTWEPSPVEVLSAKGQHLATVQEGIRPAPNSPPVLTPTPLGMPKAIPGGADLSQYRHLMP